MAHVAVAPTLGHIIERREELFDIERSDQFHPRLLKVGQPLEVVCQMAAHLQDTDVISLDLQRFGEVLFGDLYALYNRGLRQSLTGTEEVLALLEDPRTTVGRTTDHHRIDPIAIEHFGRLFAGIDVAVADNRDLDQRVVLHLADKRPVSLATIHLRTCATVDGECPNTHILQAEGDLLDVFRLFVPTKTGLDRHRFLDRFDNLARHLDHQRHIAHHPRSGTTPCDLLHGTTEVDVDHFGTCRLGHLCRLDHRFDAVAVDLDAHGTLAIVDIELTQRFGRLVHQSIRGDELRIDHISSEPLAHVAERGIGHILHRSEQNGAVAQIYVGNFHLLRCFCGVKIVDYWQ